MTAMTRRMPWRSVLLLSLAMAPACVGLSTEEAEQRCGQVREGNALCVTDEAYDECVLCYEVCGDDCVPTGACPQTYSCPD